MPNTHEADATSEAGEAEPTSSLEAAGRRIPSLSTQDLAKLRQEFLRRIRRVSTCDAIARTSDGQARRCAASTTAASTSVRPITSVS